MSQAACSNNSTGVLPNQSPDVLKIDHSYKIRVQLIVKNQYGEILHERIRYFGQSYFKRGIRKWFFDHGVSEFKIRPDVRPNHVIAAGIYSTC